MPDPVYLDERGKFKPGNPGKPKGASSARPLDASLRSKLAEIDPATGKTNAEIIAGRVVELARTGEKWACEFVKEHTEGKAREQVALDLQVNEPIQLLDIGESDDDQ